MISALQQQLGQLGLGWFDLKMLIERSIGFHNDALHVLAGVVLHLLAAALLRASLARWLPFVAVALAELGNEAIDLWVERWPDPAMQWGEGLKDLLLTLALPALLLLVARRWPHLLSR